MLEAAPSWYGARGNVGEVTIELEASPAVAADRWRSGEYDVLDDVLALRSRRRRRDRRAALAGGVHLVSRLQREAGAARRRPRPPCPRARDRPARARGASGSNRGRNGRAASADDAGALASRRPGIRPGSCPRPPERGGLRRRTCPRRDRAGVSRPVGGRGVRRGRPARGRSAFEFDFSSRPPTPISRPRSRSAPTPTSGPGAPTTPIRAAASSIRCSAGPVALPRRAARGAAGSSGLAPRPGRAPAHRTASSNESGSASKRPSCRSRTATASCGGARG